MKPGLAVLVVVCALIGVGLYALIAEVDRMSCDRGSDTCTLRQEKLYGATVATFPAHSLHDAEVGRLYPSSKGGKSRQVVLLTDGGRVGFMGYSTEVDIDGMEELVARVKSYVADPGSRNLELRRDSRLMAFLVGLVPLLFGLVMAKLGHGVQVPSQSAPHG